ncbi:hypothetical protein AGDE_15570 [Angomonas deanei]|uniref:Las1-like, putative n=1 Tax=Angomonas deanei TaxID=59799 RepID=A0A7G2C1R8_9TRYP|nr:hypothetical protein AGDE_15570 [Angomonas deanei]CAD2212663.1 Las1-like, putative [Angomonas deanei]|eukprot:EPY18837.1 hypothetical protein AGDE_15570 [Angomonas deanei]
MLLDEEDEVSSGDVHQLYGAAISRVVHVMTGSFSMGSATTYRQRAQKIGFPEEAVEVRQRVAHGALPSLSEMRWVAALTLQFLYKNYWQLQRKELMALKKRQVVKRKREEVEVKQDSGPTHSIDDIQSLLKAAQETLEDTVAEEQQPATTAQTGWTIS